MRRPRPLGPAQRLARRRVRAAAHYDWAPRRRAPDVRGPRGCGPVRAGRHAFGVDRARGAPGGRQQPARVRALGGVRRADRRSARTTRAAVSTSSADRRSARARRSSWLGACTAAAGASASPRPGAIPATALRASPRRIRGRCSRSTRSAKLDAARGGLDGLSPRQRPREGARDARRGPEAARRVALNSPLTKSALI